MLNIKPEYLRISLIDKCNLNCFYCNPNSTHFVKNHILTKNEIIYFCKILKPFGLKKIRLTGGEPTLRKDLVEIVEAINYEINPDELVMTTNGIKLDYLLKDLRKAGLKRVNISLDTLNKEKFKFITGVDALNLVLSSIRTAKEIFELVKLNTVVLKNLNDNEVCDLVNFAIKEKIIIRFIERMCLSEKLNKEFIDSQTLKKIIEKEFGKLSKLEKNNLSSSSEDYLLKEQDAIVSFISPRSTPFCKNCNRLRLDSMARLFSCLYSNECFDLSSAITSQDKDAIEKNIKDAISFKACQNNLLDKQCLRLNFASIGG